MAKPWLVGGFNHLEKHESQWEGLSHILWKIKKMFETTNQIKFGGTLLFGQTRITYLWWECWDVKRIADHPNVVGICGYGVFPWTQIWCFLVEFPKNHKLWGPQDESNKLWGGNRGKCEQRHRGFHFVGEIAWRRGAQHSHSEEFWTQQDI